MPSDVLNSWKEIASYIGRGVRTVQRWERELGFPVHRPKGKQRSAVTALKEEIDLWVRTPHGAAVHQQHRISQETNARLLRNRKVLYQRALLLVERSNVLKKQVSRAMALGSALRTSRRDSNGRN